MKELVHRTSFGKEPKNNMKATEDFLDVVLTAHILAAARELQSGSTTLPSCKDLAKQIVSRFVTISIPSTNTDSDDSTAAAQNSSNDSVFAYAVDVLSMCLIWHAFRDAVMEGDGDRIIRYWKLLAVIFRQEKHYNYSNEAVNLVMQTLLLSPRQVSELKWSRTVNTNGRIGKNIPVDLHMEHLNRRLKIMMRNLGSNISPKTTEHAAKALAIIDSVQSQFLRDTSISHEKDYHSIPSSSKDMLMMVQQLTTDKVFKAQENRQHTVYKDHVPLLDSINWNNIQKWIKERIINYN